MFLGDHSPPHFHVKYAEHKAKIEIKTGNIIAGYLPKRAKRLVQAWNEIHKKELLLNWKETQKEQPKIKKVDPLK